MPDATSDNNVDDPRNLRLSQPIQNPSLPTTYQRALLDTRAGVEKGGESGPVVVPGKPEDSLLLRAVRERIGQR